MKRAKFNLSHYKLLSCNQGQLVPCGLVEVLPGDTIQHATSLLLRTQPLVTPVMHPVHVRIHHWFVPHRLVWSDWEDFITGGPDPDSAPTFPTITINNAAVGSLADYLGVPTGVAQNVAVSALPFRAYALVFNEWYRDQDLTTALVIDKTDGADITTNTTLQFAPWEKDYFTTSRPWAQKGTEVTLPLGTSAPVSRTTNAEYFELYEAGSEVKGSNQPLSVNAAGRLTNDGNTKEYSIDPRGQLYANLAGATAASINDIRLAIALQKFQEARARYGSRYSEYLKYLGVRSSDARLQRPEYLGGGKQTIQFSEVLQTGVTTSGNTAGVGNLRGHGIAASRSNRYRRFFEEHGYIISLLSVKPRTMYFEGLSRHWKYSTRNDFFQRELQHIGQQEVTKGEIYMSDDATNAQTWGYQDRYDHLRRMESSLAGDMRSTLNTWHMARDFSGVPTLNSSFVVSDPTNRIYAVTADTQLYVMAYHSMQARRLLAQVGNPSGIL